MYLWIVVDVRPVFTLIGSYVEPTYLVLSSARKYPPISMRMSLSCVQSFSHEEWSEALANYRISRDWVAYRLKDTLARSHLRSSPSICQHV